MDLDSYSKTTKNVAKQKTEMQQLLLDIFKRIDEVNSIQDLSKFIPIEELTQENQEQDSILISQYIKQIVFYLSKQKLEYQSQLLNKSEDEQQSYEAVIQKLENDVRQHIRIEQQQRLHIENLESKLEEAIQIYEDDTLKLKQEIDHLKKQLKDRNYHKSTKSYTQNNYLPSTQSTLPSTSQRKKSTSEKKLDVIQQFTDRQQHQSKPRKKTQQSSSGAALPKQIQDLFNKMHTEIDNSTQKESKSVNKSRNTRSQKISRDKDVKAIEKSDIIKNLQQQFEDSDKLKEIEQELNDTYLTQRDTSQVANEVANYGSQKYYFHQIKKAINGQDLNKSSSYEAMNRQKSKDRSVVQQKTLSLLRQHSKKRTPC